MGVEVSTDGGPAVREGESAAPSSGVPNKPILSPSSRAGRARAADKGDDGAHVGKRQVLVGAKMGGSPITSSGLASHGTSRSAPQTATSQPVAVGPVSASARVLPVSGRGALPTAPPVSKNSGTRTDSSAGLGSTSELYSVASIVPDEKASEAPKASVATRPRPAPSAPARTSGAAASTASTTTLNAAQERRQRHGEHIKETKASAPSPGMSAPSSGTSFTEMEFRPSDVNDFFDAGPHADSPSESPQLTRASLVAANSDPVVRKRKAPPGAPLSPKTVRELARATSLLDTSLHSFSAGAPNRVVASPTTTVRSNKTTTTAAATAKTGSTERLPHRGSVLSSHEEGTSASFRRHSSQRSNSSHGSFSATANGQSGGKTVGSDLNVKPSRRTPSKGTVTATNAKATTARALPLRRTMLPVPSTAAAITGRGATGGARTSGTTPALRRSDSRTGTSLYDSSTATGAGEATARRHSTDSAAHNKSFLSIGSTANVVGMGSLYDAKGVHDEGSGREGGDFYGASGPVTSLYKSAVDDVDDDPGIEEDGRGHNAAASLYLSEQPLLFNASRRNTTSGSSGNHNSAMTSAREADSSSVHGTSGNASFFAMRDQSFGGSAANSQGNSRINRSANGTTTTTPQTTHVPSSPLTQSREANASGTRGQAQSPAMPVTPSPKDTHAPPSASSLLPVSTETHAKSQSVEQAADGSLPPSVGPYELLSFPDLQYQRPPRTTSNASSRNGSRDSRHSLSESVASSVASSRSSSVSSTVSRRDVNGLQRRAAAQSKRSPGTSVSGNFQGRYVNAGSRKKNPGMSDEVIHTPSGGEVGGCDIVLLPTSPAELNVVPFRGMSASMRRRRGTLTTFADNGDADGGGAGHDTYNKFFTRSSSQNGISTDKDDGQDDGASSEAKANTILVQLSNNSSAGSEGSQNGSGRGAVFRPVRPPAASFKPLSVSADKFKLYQQTYGVGDAT